MPADLPFPASSRPPRPAAGGVPAPDGTPAAGASPGEIIWESDGIGPADGPPAGGPAHRGHGSEPDPDRRTVRVAWAADAPAVAAVQHADLVRALAGSGVETPLAAELEPVWLRAITRPPTARHRVFVAVESDVVLGFVATGPAADPDSDVALDGDVPALHVVRDAARTDVPDTAAGGASELLGALVAAAADALAADGFSRAQLWVGSTDNLLRRVLDDAGWTPDGASRALADDDEATPPDPADVSAVDLAPGDTAGVGVGADEDGPLTGGGVPRTGIAPVKQVRLHTGLV